MNVAQVLDHFERICDAPDAVPRLRRFILDLAVRGKLVEQDPNDEPVSELLKRMGRAKSDNVPFQIPSCWQWVRIGEIAECRLGKMLDKAKNKGTPRRYLRNVNVRWFDFDLSDVLEMRFEDSELDEFSIRSGDVLICEGGEPGRAAVWDEREADIYFQKAIHRMRLPKSFNPHYFVNVLRVSAESGRLAAYFTGVGIKHFTGKGLSSFLIPLPPLAEQQRIVAKVDELMALCGRLEAARVERESRRDKLAATSLHRLNNGADADKFREHVRFHLRRLPQLTTRPEHIQQLRQTILNLAVRGKLVPQDPKDEPVAELFKRIQEEKARMVKEGTIRKSQPLRTLNKKEAPFVLPQNWEWLRLGTSGFTQTGTTPPTSKPEYFGNFIPFVKPADLTGNTINYHGEGLSELGVQHSRLIPKKAVLMVCIGSSIGKVNVTDRTVCCNQQINTVTPYLDGMTAFTSFALRATYFQKHVFDNAGMGTLPIISKGKWEQLPVPLPPLAEQCRIVAKVNELMAVCDRLEGQLAASKGEIRRFLEAVLHEALNNGA